jgi:hypothetical protein
LVHAHGGILAIVLGSGLIVKQDGNRFPMNKEISVTGIKLVKKGAQET